MFEIEEQDYRTALGAVANSGHKTVLEAIHTLENVGKIIWQNRVSRLEAAFPPSVLRQIAYKEIVFLLGRVREMREAEYAHNDDLRSKGMSFAERMKSISRSKIDWCDKEEARYMQMLQSFTVRPLREWFDEVDYDAAKSMGMSWVVRHKLDEIINV